MEKLTKQDLRGPDAFISTMDRVSHWIFERRMILGIGVATAAIAAIVWALLGTYSSKQEDDAGETLFAAEKTLKTTDSKFQPPKPKVDAKGKQVPSAATATGKIDQDYKDAVEQLKDVISRFPKTQASVIAALDLSRIFHEYKQDNQSIPFLENATKAARHPVTQAMTFMNLGVAYEAVGDCKNAIGQWQKIQEKNEMAAFQANALIKQALCYEKLNQKERATEIYSRFDRAENERRQLLESLAAKYGINLRIPPQYLPKDKVRQFQKEMDRSSEFQRLGALLSDRESVKAAKKYLLLLKQGSS